MALLRRSGQRLQASIWPGFVDAMTGLLLVLMFVLTIFMVMLFALRETITGQAGELNLLSSEVAALSRALGLEENRSATLDERVGALTATLSDARAQQEALLLDKEALQLSVANLRDEVSAEAEAARLAAAARDALEALAADLRAKAGEVEAQLTDVQAELSDAEAARLAQAAAAEMLRDKLKNSQTELSAMTLALEEQRRRAEETLTLLAAARKGGIDLEAEMAALKQDQQQTMEEMRAKLAAALLAKLSAEQEATTQLSAAEERAALLSEARKTLSAQEVKAEASARAEELLNQQVGALRDQLGQLQALLDDSTEREAASNIELQSLGQDLNAAIARVAAEEKRRREAEEEKNKLLVAQKQDLEKYRSEFFGRLRDVLGNQPGVRIEGDRFVFSSEVLFAQGEAVLSSSGKNEIGKVAEILRKVVGDIPDGIDWIIRVDGHTDNVPIRASSEFADNWELSQARALSVVRYMIDFLGVPADRLAANGFGQYQPVAEGDSPEARAQNRRIELKFTER